MKKYTLKRWHLDLAVSDFTDGKRDELLAAIDGAAPTSQLIQNNPAMKASVATLSTKGDAYKADRDKVANAQQALSIAFDASNASRAAVDLELLTLGGLVATNAKTAADITGAGFTQKPPKPSPPPLEPPPSLDLKFPKRKMGQFTVTPHVPKNDHSHWVVETSPDPIGPGTWTVAHGTGKARIITGASGSKVWVRYAMVRGGQISDWGTPVLVTIP